MDDTTRWEGLVGHRMVIAAAIAVLFASLLVEFFLERYPMSGVHWDAPIYLKQAKEFSEGGYVESYRARSSLISDSLTGKVKSADGLDYWRFARLGHIALAGTIVSLTGSDEKSIFRLTWAYRVLFAAGLAFALVMTLALVPAFGVPGDRSAAPLAALISLALYLLSDSARYMSGNLVTEVPSIFLLCAAGWLLIRSFRTRSHLGAAVSGLLAFLLYVVAMDGIWSYLTLLGLVTWYFGVAEKAGLPQVWWRGILTVALAAGIPFVAYSIVFFPLTDPRLMLLFANASIDQHVKQPLAFGAVLHGIVQRPVVAVGFLSVGTLLALPMLVRSRVARFGFAWLVLVALLPSSIALASGSVAEVRKYTLCVPAALLLSTLGWANFIGWSRRSRATLDPTGNEIGAPNSAALLASKSGGSRLAMGMLILALMGLSLISFPASYEWLRGHASLWRLQQVRPWLAVPRYERVDYHVPELVQVYQALRRQNAPLVLVASPGMQGGDYHHIIDFLSSPIQAPDSLRGSNVRPARGIRVVEGQSENDVHDLLAGLPLEAQLFLLKMRGEAWPRSESRCCGSRKPVLATEHFQLEELVGEPATDPPA